MGSQIPILLLDRKLRECDGYRRLYGGTRPWLMPQACEKTTHGPVDHEESERQGLYLL